LNDDQDLDLVSFIMSVQCKDKEHAGKQWVKRIKMIGRLGVFVTAEKVRGRRRSFAARMEPI